MGEVVTFPLERRVDRWAEWEKSLSAVYFEQYPSAGLDVCQEQAHLLVLAWKSAPQVANFGRPEEEALVMAGCAYIGDVPPSKMFRDAIVKWLNTKDR